MHVLHSPLWVPKNGKGDKWYLNLNNYRNTHYQTLNKTKIAYKFHMKSQIERLPFYEKVGLTFVIYAKDKRKFDVDNVCAVHSKYFADALVEFGKLTDDSYIFIPETHNYFGDVDKDNPRVEIIIREPMAINYG